MVTALEDGDWSGVAEAWLQRSPQACGAPVSVSPPDRDGWSGTSAGLDDDGALLVRDSDGGVHAVRQIESVRFRED